MSNSPRFTVVIATHDRPALLAEAVSSVLAQSVHDLELVVVDDGSSIPAVVHDDDRVRLIRLDTCGGPAEARNVGIDAACGDLVTFLDDDDVYTADRLAIAQQGIGEADLHVCAGGEVGSTRISRPWMSGDVSDTVLDRTPSPLGTVTVRRTACPLFDSSFVTAEDLDWWLRAARLGPVAASDQVGWLWRRHDGVRANLGHEARLAGNRHLLDVHARYFDTHPTAHAFRWIRIGWLERSSGRPSAARHAARTALAIDPSVVTVRRALRLLAGR
jgi:glycosyltransferase involved in cell wall biosynthesis